MREFIGHRIKMTVREAGVVEGLMVSENKSFVFLKEDDGIIHRYPRGHIVHFCPLDFEPVEYVPFHVLSCRNKVTACPGVQFIQQGEGVRPADFETFMGPCPCRADTCDFGTKGELRTVDGKVLGAMFKDVLFGDYPEEGKECASAGVDDAVGDGPEHGRGDGEAEV